MKEAIDAFAHERGTTLSAGIAELLERGLTATTDEASVKRLTLRLERARAKEADLDARLKTADAELRVVRALGNRAEQKIGTCPECNCEITGIDVFAKFKCPSKGHSLVSLIAPSAPQLSQRDTMLLFGALGAVMALALIAGRS